jgi:hypothetical protein
VLRLIILLVKSDFNLKSPEGKSGKENFRDFRETFWRTSTSIA